MADLKGPGKMKMKYHFHRFNRLLSKNEHNVTKKIKDTVNSDRNVKYVGSYLKKTESSKYNLIFGGYSNPTEVIDKCSKCSKSSFNLTNLFEKYALSKINGYTYKEHNDNKKIGYRLSEKSTSNLWFLYQMGEEIRRRAKIAKDLIKKDKEVPEDLYPKWYFIEEYKKNVNEIIKESSSKTSGTSGIKNKTSEDKGNCTSITAENKRNAAPLSQELENKLSLKKLDLVVRAAILIQVVQSVKYKIKIYLLNRTILNLPILILVNWRKKIVRLNSCQK